MDNQNQNNSISTQGQNNDIVKGDIAILFAGDSYGLFVFQKTEKLVKAIYLLTGLMSDKEPMKERSREIANKMLETALDMSDRIWGEEIYHKNLLGAISEISVLFNVAESTKMMSKMNHQIIISELKKLADFLITSSANYSSAKIAFEPNLFDGNYNYIPDQNFQIVPPFNNQIIKTNDSVKDTTSIDKEQRTETFNKTNEKVSETKNNVSEKPIKDKNNRSDIILSMLKSGVKLTIKDFAKNIKDCSEKTIQRELLSLVSKGLLKKEGERRWSKYFIAK